MKRQSREMKQRGLALSENRQAGPEETTDLDAWLGYEFWSAQVEAQIISEQETKYGEWPEPCKRERGSDVLPF
jgi:hypothetical protein